MNYSELLVQWLEDQLASDKQSCIPINLDRAGHIINLRQGHYTLIGGGTGTGKTSFVDEKYVLEPYDWMKAHPESEIKVRWFYRSMERRAQQKFAKWVSNKIFRDKKMLISSDEILMANGNRLPAEKFQLIKEYSDYFDEMLDYVDIQDGVDNPFGIFKPLEHYSHKNGILLKIKYNDKAVVLYDHSTNGVKIKDYLEETFVITKAGEKRYFEEVEIKGKKYKVFLKKPVYIPDDPNLYVVPIIDHIGKTSSIEGKDERGTINKTSELLSTLRDTFLQSPIVVSQFNRSLADVGRMKLFKGDLQPQLEDFESSARTQHDADLVLALFNPYRYKSYDADGMYKDYSIRDKLVSPGGHNRFRTLSILKNSFGIDDVTIALRFTGESGSFQTLPLPGTPSLEMVYDEISQGF